MDFFTNLEKYKPYEIEASKRIEKLNNTSTLNFCNNYKYDFITSDNITYEVKTEPKSLKTNNFFIEFSGYGKPSGISTSESNFYIFCDTINYYLIDIHKLKQIIENFTLRIVSTGDGLTFGYLISKHIIITNSIKI